MRKDSSALTVIIDIKKAGYEVIVGKELELRDVLMNSAEEKVKDIQNEIVVSDLFNKQRLNEFILKLGNVITNSNNLNYWVDINVNTEFINKELQKKKYVHFLKKEREINKKRLKNVVFLALLLFEKHLSEEKSREWKLTCNSISYVLITSKIIDYSRFLTSWWIPRTDNQTKEIMIDLNLFLLNPSKYLSTSERVNFYKLLLDKILSMRTFSDARMFTDLEIDSAIKNILFFEQNVIKSGKSNDYYLEKLNQ